jgi:S-adenosylmethionine-diacylglycerol 3-amino-3-carboxypropyl transferase
MSFLYNFGLSQEDERTEAAALELSSLDRVLSIASAGDMPLSLLALGANRVDAVDVDPAQLHLTRLKLAATRSLDRADAVAFLGFLPAPATQRLVWLHHLLPALPEPSRRFWLRNKDSVQSGAIWAGRYEQYVARIVRVALPVLGRKGFDALFECTSIAQQQVVFRSHFDRRRMRLLFDVAFHPKIFSSRGMDPRSLQHRSAQLPLGQQYFQHFRALCTATPAWQNHLLQLTLLGRVLNIDVVPAYLSEAGVRVIRERADHLQLVQSDLVSYLEKLEPGGFDKAHLSNLPDWLDQDAFDHVMHLLAHKAAPGARFVWRYIHVSRPIPVSLRQRIVVDPERGQALRETDRFPFYAVVCGSVAGEQASQTSPIKRSVTAPEPEAGGNTPRFRFLPLAREQGPALLEINRACPIEADFTLVFDRGQDFFQWPDLLYDRHHYVGIHHDDTLVGYCMTGELRGWTGNTQGRCFYGGDARILRPYRGHRLAELGLRHALELLSDDVEIGFGLVKSGNAPAQRTVDTGYSELFGEARRLPFEAVNVLLLRKLPRPSVEIRNARLDDLEDMAELFTRANARRLFAPEIDAERLEKDMTIPGLEPHRWYVAVSGRRLVGMAAAWDQHAFHRTQILRYSPAGTGIRTLYGMSRTVFRHAPPLPPAGEALRTVTLTRVAVEDMAPSVMRALIHGVVNDHVGKGYHLLHVGFAGEDPMRQASTGLLCQRFRSGIVIGARRRLPRCEAWFNSVPYVDMAVI